MGLLLTLQRCHGDIKPANILSVKGRLKLADPGEARIELRKADGQPRTAMTGGTRSYGELLSPGSRSSGLRPG